MKSPPDQREREALDGEALKLGPEQSASRLVHSAALDKSQLVLHGLEKR